eukprot:TRINITY_DN7792_c0_g1_i4.p1 TRINITY_DN7792_c0_g1~~TRINITY_DN7792_c0_g1_i4.p1  ORF type:complete len:806 (+),score=138.54 TRINITY_DN7792_c0_g1_i4:79-2496(+)
MSITSMEDNAGVFYVTGDNTDGQLGNGSRTHLFAFEGVTALQGQIIKKVALGFRHSMALTYSGKMYVWGSSANNQLGTGYNDHSVPSPINLEIDGGSRVVDVATKSNFCAAITEDGTLYTWGYNGNYGNLGRPGDDSKPAIVFEGLRGSTVQSVALGNDHALALSADGILFSWGRGEEGQLGYDVDTIEHVVPKEIDCFTLLLRERPFYNRVIQITCGKSFSMALTACGDVYTWGSNSEGQCGHGNLSDIFRPRKIEKLMSMFVTKIAAGWKHACAVIDDGKLYTWGANEAGQLGTCDRLIRRTPTQVYALSGEVIKDASAGWRHTVALTDLGYVYTWGACERGQCGLRVDEFQAIDAATHPDAAASAPSTSSQSIPVSKCFFAPQLALKAPAMASIATGYEHTIILPQTAISSPLAVDLLRLFDDCNLCGNGDIVFCIGEDRLFAHCDIIASRAPAFGNFIDATGHVIEDGVATGSLHKQRSVLIRDVPVYVLRALLVYIYSDADVTQLNIEPNHGSLFNMDQVDVPEDETELYESFRANFPRPKYEHRSPDVSLAHDLLVLAEKYRLIRLKQFCQNILDKYRVAAVKSTLAADMKRMMQNTKGSDAFDILLSHRSIEAAIGVHSFMLKFRAPGFLQKVIGNSESTAQSVDVFSMDEVHPESLSVIVEYIYTGVVRYDKEKHPHLLYDLIKAAVYADIPPLLRFCESRLGISPQLHNVALILNAARLSSANRLEKRCYYIMSRNLKELSGMLGIFEEDFEKAAEMSRLVEHIDPVIDDINRSRVQSVSLKETVSRFFGKFRSKE